jgi:hypothetical protein
MKVTDVIKSVVWAVAGAVFVGGGMVVGRFATLVEQQARADDPAAGKPPEPRVARDPDFGRRLDRLASSVASLEARVEAVTSAPGNGQVEAITERVDQLERLVEQTIAQTPPLPPIDQVLGAVEQMVSARIGGLDERLTDQVHAIELLRSASAQTDVLLHRLIQAVEGLAHPLAAGRETPPGSRRGQTAADEGELKEWDSPLG